MNDPVFLLGQLCGYGLLGFWCYSAWITGSFVGVAIKAPFEKEPPSEPRKKEDPIPRPATRPQATCTLDEGCATMGVSLGILKSYVASGTIRTYKDGKSLVLNTDDVVKLGKKPPKRAFPVIDEYKEEHKITHPFESDD
jgi:hypothetical protein